MLLLIEPDGSIRTVYDETLDLSLLGQVSIARGSHVEPDEQGQWFVDLSPVAGPKLGPFPGRSAALTAERDWLEVHWLVPSE